MSKCHACAGIDCMQVYISLCIIIMGITGKGGTMKICISCARMQGKRNVIEIV